MDWAVLSTCEPLPLPSVHNLHIDEEACIHTYIHACIHTYLDMYMYMRMYIRVQGRCVHAERVFLPGKTACIPLSKMRGVRPKLRCRETEGRPSHSGQVFGVV